MRDPYDILGVKRGASLEEIKAAYRRRSKETHPDLGGSHEAFIELQNAYASILNELKSEQQRQRAEAPEDKTSRQSGADKSAGPDDMWTNEAFWRDIDEELEGLRRATEFYEEAFRARRAKAWERGDPIGWAKLSLADIGRFFRELLRTGARGIILLFTALAGVGAIIAQFNLVSALIILGSGFGLFVSLAMKNDKGGVMSAFLLLFGLLTVWSPPVRAAVLTHPFATISALICLGLIAKFIQQRSFVGLATGGMLAIYILMLIAQDTRTASQLPSAAPQTLPNAAQPANPTPRVPAPPPPQTPQSPLPPNVPRPPVYVQPAPTRAPPPPADPQTLLAASGSVLRFVDGVPYDLRVRGGMTTYLVAVSGRVAFYRGDTPVSECTSELQLSRPPGAAPYQSLDRQLRACGGDAVFRVTEVR